MHTRFIHTMVDIAISTSVAAVFTAMSVVSGTPSIIQASLPMYAGDTSVMNAQFIPANTMPMPTLVVAPSTVSNALVPTQALGRGDGLLGSRCGTTCTNPYRCVATPPNPNAPNPIGGVCACGAGVPTGTACDGGCLTDISGSPQCTPNEPSTAYPGRCRDFPGTFYRTMVDCQAALAAMPSPTTINPMPTTMYPTSIPVPITPPPTPTPMPVPAIYGSPTSVTTVVQVPLPAAPVPATPLPPLPGTMTAPIPAPTLPGTLPAPIPTMPLPGGTMPAIPTPPLPGTLPTPAPGPAQNPAQRTGVGCGAPFDTGENALPIPFQCNNPNNSARADCPTNSECIYHPRSWIPTWLGGSGPAHCGCR